MVGQMKRGRNCRVVATHTETFYGKPLEHAERKGGPKTAKLTQATCYGARLDWLTTVACNAVSK